MWSANKHSIDSLCNNGETTRPSRQLTPLSLIRAPVLLEAVCQLIHDSWREVVQTPRELVADHVNMESVRKHLGITNRVFCLDVFRLGPVHIDSGFWAIVDGLELLRWNYDESSAVHAGCRKDLVSARILGHYQFCGRTME